MSPPLQPFPQSQCHHCQHVRYVHTKKSQQVYLMCRKHSARYLPQPQLHCQLYQVRLSQKT